jgi:hypothetical protein
MIQKLFQVFRGYNGVRRVPDDVTINGQTVPATAVYRTGDAGSGPGLPAHIGEDLVEAGTGAAIDYNVPAYGNGVLDRAIRFNLGKSLRDPTGLGAQLGAGDFFFDIVVQVGSTDGWIAGTYLTQGYEVYRTGGKLSFLINNAGGIFEFKTDGTFTDELVHACCFGNRDENSTNGAGWFVNSVASTGANISTYSGTTPGSNFTMGANPSGVNNVESSVLYFGMWEQADLFSAGATGKAEAQALATDRFQLYCDLFPELAAGTPNPDSVTAEETFIEVYDAADAATGTHHISDGIAPVGRILDGVGVPFEGVRLAGDTENLAVWSMDFSSWGSARTSYDKSNLIETTEPGRFYQGLVADTTNSTHPSFLAISLPSAGKYCFSVEVKKGSSDYLRLSNVTLSANTFFDTDAGVVFSESGPVYMSGVTELKNGRILLWQVTDCAAGINQFYIYLTEDGVSSSFQGDSITPQTYAAFAQVEPGTSPGPRILTEGATGSRTADAIEYDLSDGNITPEKFHIRFKYLAPYGPTTDAFGSAPLMLLGGTPNLAFRVTDAGLVTVGGLTSTTDVTDGLPHLIEVFVDGEDDPTAATIKLYIDEVVEDSTTSASVATSYALLELTVQDRDSAGPVQWVGNVQIYSDNPYDVLYGDGSGLQEGDVLLYQTLDDGEMNIVDGITELTPTFDTMVYLSLFGGNVDDPGGSDTTKQWWGNFGEPEASKQYRSETQYLLRSLPMTSANLKRLEKAATRDLTRDFLDTGIASEVSVEVSIERLNWVKISATINALGERSTFTFTENWEASL